MPYSTPEAKLKRNRDWRRSRSAGYYSWLYQRRKLRFDKAKAYEKALHDIIAAHRLVDADAIATSVLAEFERRERKLGNHFSHEDDRGVWVIE